jgi:hypothetical protein
MGAARNVGEGLIDGNPLNEGRKIINYLDGRIAQPLVVLEMAANKNELRAELARPSAWHTPADPVGPGFVRSSEHDSATDSDRLAAQRWIEQLLNRSIERIQVRMKDRGSRFQLFFVHQEQLYTRCKLSELINTEPLSNGRHPVHHAFETIVAIAPNPAPQENLGAANVELPPQDLAEIKRAAAEIQIEGDDVFLSSLVDPADSNPMPPRGGPSKNQCWMAFSRRVLRSIFPVAMR